MALKALMLRRSIDKKNKELETLRAKDVEFSSRETELEKAIHMNRQSPHWKQKSGT